MEEKKKRWRIAISEDQVMRASMKTMVEVVEECEAREDVVVSLSVNLAVSEWRVFRGEGEPPQKLMELAYSGTSRSFSTLNDRESLYYPVCGS